MKSAAINTFDTFEDCYPSRGGRKAETIARLDPVVYARNGTECPVDPSLIRQYEEQGFLILDNIFSEKEIGCFVAELERMKRDPAIKSREEAITELESGGLRSVFRIHELSPVFGRLAGDPRLAGLAEYILNDRVYIHQSRLNYKPGFEGKEFYWHSDFETWHVEDGLPRMRALSLSITLTENFTYNGPLMLIPGSHKSYVICEGHTPENHFKSSLKKQEYGVPGDDQLRKLVEAGGIVSATGKPGSVILFDCNTMHGSNGNITPFPRSNVFFVYNSISNRVLSPFCDQPPRPEFIVAREIIEPVTVEAFTVPGEHK